MDISKISDTIYEKFGNRYEFVTGRCGEFAVALGCILDTIGIDFKLIVGGEYENDYFRPMHAFIEVGEEYIDFKGFDNNRLLSYDRMESDVDIFMNNIHSLKFFSFDSVIDLAHEIGEYLGVEPRTDFACQIFEDDDGW